MNNSRERFEKWSCEEAYGRAKDHNGFYKHMLTQAAWHGWQARDAEIQELCEVLGNLLRQSEKHIFSNECQQERDAARAKLAKYRGNK